MANIFKKISNSLRLDDDEDFDDDEFEPDEDFDDLDYREEPKKASPKPVSKKYESELSLDDDEDPEPKPAPRKVFRTSRRGSYAPVNAGAAMEVCMIKPTNMEDSREISDILCSGRAVVINMEGVNLDLSQRIIDFVSGSVWAIKGKLQTISAYIFIVTPKNIDLTGDFTGSVGGGSDTVSYNI